MTVEEYNQCYKKYFKTVCGYLRLFCKDADMCEDITQDTFMKLWERHESIRLSSVRQWLHAISYNRMIDYKRKDGHRDRYINSGLKEDYEQYMGGGDVETVMREIELLPEVKRNLILGRIDDISYRDLAAKYELSDSQVKAQLHSGRRKLNKQLGYYEEY